MLTDLENNISLAKPVVLELGAIASSPAGTVVAGTLFRKWEFLQKN